MNMGIHCSHKRHMSRNLSHCLFKILIKLKNTTQHPLKRKWTVSIGKNRKFYWAKMGEPCFSIRLPVDFPYMYNLDGYDPAYLSIKQVHLQFKD